MSTATPALPTSSRASLWSWPAKLGCGVAMMVIMAFYLWTAQSPLTPYSLRGAGQDYYNLLAQGFTAGKLSLPIAPDPALLKLRDPYDPEQSVNIPKLHDASFYKGKYYLYFGAGPALAWFVPWKLLTGGPISENLSVAIFCCAGFGLWSWLVLRVARRHFPGAGGGLAVWAVLLLGLGNMCAVLLRRAAFWEVPIAGAYFFNALWAWCVWRALISARRVHLWLAFASLALGFSVSARPGGVFMGGGMGLLALWFARPRATGGRWLSRRTFTLLIAACGPLALCVGGVLTYNFARFENPFEFGTTYQIAGHNMHTWKMLDWANVPINVYYYFFSPAQFTVYFPFFDVIGNPPFKAPKDYYGIENVYGVVPNLPVVLCGIAAFGAFFARRVRDRAALLALIFGIGAAFLLGLPVLLRYAASASRYMIDFVPWLIALAVFGILIGETNIVRKSWRAAFRVTWVALAVWSITFNFFVSLQHNDLLRQNHPTAFNRFARFFNHASPLLEKLTDSSHGPLELKLRLPKNRIGQLEPLVVAGLSFHADYVYLYYTDPTHVQIGFEHTSYGGKVSQPILVDYDAVQSVRIELGSLYPPMTHPYFSGSLASRALELKHWLKITVNGVPYLDFNAEFAEASPKDVVIGRDPLHGAFGWKFTGAVISAERKAGTSPPESHAAYGAVRLAVKFPEGKTGHHEPLVVTGRPGRGDILYLTYLDEKHVQLGIDHWGFGEVKSDPIEVNFELIHLFEIDLGSLHPPPAGELPKAGFDAPYEVKLDGVPVLYGRANFHPCPPTEIFLTLNPIGGSTASADFTGRVFQKETLPPRDR